MELSPYLFVRLILLFVPYMLDLLPQYLLFENGTGGITCDLLEMYALSL